jgi:hypothetical protein
MPLDFIRFFFGLIYLQTSGARPIDVWVGLQEVLAKPLVGEGQIKAREYAEQQAEWEVVIDSARWRALPLVKEASPTEETPEICLLSANHFVRGNAGGCPLATPSSFPSSC